MMIMMKGANDELAQGTQEPTVGGWSCQHVNVQGLERRNEWGDE